MDILRKELIGLDMKVVDARNPSLVGVQGRIINETQNTITIEAHKEIRLIKKQVVFEITHQGKKIRIDGKSITKKPEERVKSR